MTNEEKSILEQGNDLLLSKLSAQIPTEKDSKQREALRIFVKKTIVAGEKLREVETEEEIQLKENTKIKNLKKESCK